MKLVTFLVAGPFGTQRRLGALVGQERIVDLTTSYATYLAQQTDEPTPRELALLRVPPDLIGWLRGQHKSREAAEQALAFVDNADLDTRGLDGARLVFTRKEVALLAPLPRPNSLRDFSIFEEHMTRREDGPIAKRASWYRWPGYTILIDCSARDPYLFQNEFLGPAKMKDWATVLGPCMVTADEIDEANLDVRITVDDEVWFDGNTSAPRSFLAHHLVAYASDNETLQPGDVLGTGTVSYSCSVDLHRWPQVGQRVRFEVSGIGVLEHTIVAGTGSVDYVKNGMNGLLPEPSELVGSGSAGRWPVGYQAQDTPDGTQPPPIGVDCPPDGRV